MVKPKPSMDWQRMFLIGLLSELKISCSSEPSRQSVFPLHLRLMLIHMPSLQVNSKSEQDDIVKTWTWWSLSGHSYKNKWEFFCTIISYYRSIIKHCPIMWSNQLKAFRISDKSFIMKIFCNPPGQLYIKPSLSF